MVNGTEAGKVLRSNIVDHIANCRISSTATFGESMGRYKSSIPGNILVIEYVRFTSARGKLSKRDSKTEESFIDGIGLKGYGE